MNQLSLGFPEAYTSRASYRIVVPPALEPVSVTDVRDALGLGDAPSSGALQRMIQSARELAEAYTGRAFLNQTLEMQLDTFPAAGMPWWDGVRQGARRSMSGDGAIMLFRPPVSEITSVTYVTSSGATNTVDATGYYIDTIVEPNRLLLNEAGSWPVDPRVRAAVTITYVAGYGATPASLPALIVEAMLAHIGDQIDRPNHGVLSQRIDNAATTYSPSVVATAAAGALRGGAAAMLASLRVLPSV